MSDAKQADIVLDVLCPNDHEVVARVVDPPRDPEHPDDLDEVRERARRRQAGARSHQMVRVRCEEGCVDGQAPLLSVTQFRATVDEVLATLDVHPPTPEQVEAAAVARYEQALAEGLSDAEARDAGWPNG